MIIDINTKLNIISIQSDEYCMQNEWTESKHPRDENGKFAEKGAINIHGNELAGFGVSGSELRTAAVDYYKKHLAGTSVKHPELGEILFSQGGYKKPISFSADEHKLKLFPFLPDIIKHGKLIKKEPDRDGRRNINAFYVLCSVVILNKEKVYVRVNIREDNQGNLYYDHVIAKEKTSGQRSGPATNPAEMSKGFNNSVGQDDWIVNIFFDKDA